MMYYIAFIDIKMCEFFEGSEKSNEDVYGLEDKFQIFFILLLQPLIRQKTVLKAGSLSQAVKTISNPFCFSACANSVAIPITVAFIVLIALKCMEFYVIGVLPVGYWVYSHYSDMFPSECIHQDEMQLHHVIFVVPVFFVKVQHDVSNLHKFCSFSC
jgi:hypothetical protein